MPVPNLDNMSLEKLLEFSERHNFGRQFKLLFPFGGMTDVRDTWTLSMVADMLARERMCRARGEPDDMSQALVFKQLAEFNYGKLSPSAQWRKR